MADTAKNKQTYTYIRIADVKSGIHNVFGVVKFSKLPVRSRGTDFFQVLSITDESLPEDEKMVINLFYSNTEDFPSASVGDVIRLHRLRVESFGDELKGRPGPGFSWLLVHDDVDNPSCSSKKYTYSDHSKRRVEELQKWGREQSWARDSPTSSTVADLEPSHYCDLVCQVVGTVTEQKGVCFVARVWDGTCCRYNVADTASDMELDPTLEEMAGNLTVDVWIYDDHVASCQDIKAGHFIKLSNLHAAVYKGENARVKQSTESSVLELVLHRGTSYGRGVVVLDPRSPQVAAVRQRMDRLLLESGPSKSSNRASDPTGTVTKDPPDQQQSGNQKATPITADRGPAQNTAGESGTSHRAVTESPKQGCSHWDDRHLQKGHPKKGYRQGKDIHKKDPQESEHQAVSPAKDPQESEHQAVSPAKRQRMHVAETSATCSKAVTQPSLAPQVCSDLGSESNPVVISSGSASDNASYGDKNKERGGDHHPHGLAATTSDGEAVERDEESRRGHDGDKGGGTHSGDKKSGNHGGENKSGDQSTDDRSGASNGDKKSRDHSGENKSSGNDCRDQSADNKSGTHSRDKKGGGDHSSGDLPDPDNELGGLLSSSGSSGAQGKELQPSLQSSTETCMLQTASVISGHHHISRTTIRDVLRHAVPSKFRLLAHLVDFHPNTLDPRHLVRQLCSKCFFLATPYREQEVGTKETATGTQQSAVKSVASALTSKLAGLLGGRFANWNPDHLQTPEPEHEATDLCPRCKSDGMSERLELIYMLRLVLQDSSGDYLVANLWRENAITFFRGVSPEMALTSRGTIDEFVKTLRGLCVGGGGGGGGQQAPTSSLPPRLDCCVFSYSARGAVNFHVFDTVLV
ncbi:uncharacterized protein LOC143299839 [Babylonia areolata]|uniref:uncharacterized protein LOC143299839 n=1 Tax=Babylonia areolata TaxID=304850 RepID=UPI003FCF0202